VVVAADAGHPVVQALVRWDPAGLAARELADRRALGFPPVTRIAALSASPAALGDFLDALRLPPGADVLGPVPEPPRPGADGERERYLVRVPRTEGVALARALHDVQGVRSARKAPEHVRVELDPLDLA
jgi:primosomal protein N' (replication factor Y)